MTAASSACPWTAIALSADIETATSAGVLVDGAERVVWRDEKGAIHVWEDRCPHRGMRMSFGFVRGDHIACLYHGWRYDSAGQCRYIPAHPDLDVPKTIRIATFAALERAGLIWTAAADADPATMPAGLPDGDRDILPVRSLFIDRSLAMVREAVLKSPPSGFAATVADKGVIALHGEDGDAIAALQPRDMHRTALHITLVATETTASRRALALWASDLRHRLEAAATETAQ